ncbi:hypothetical protein BGZ49_008942 [Haplosporangium sp. Z 27]|nr:hypothetical protein BGZ49_008942 [Haplosporangium sp. Z 27]
MRLQATIISIFILALALSASNIATAQQVSVACETCLYNSFFSIPNCKKPGVNPNLLSMPNPPTMDPADKLCFCTAFSSLSVLISCSTVDTCGTNYTTITGPSAIIIHQRYCADYSFQNGSNSTTSTAGSTTFAIGWLNTKVIGFVMAIITAFTFTVL